mgnify:CR=1 FL=1
MVAVRLRDFIKEKISTPSADINKLYKISILKGVIIYDKEKIYMLRM